MEFFCLTGKKTKRFIWVPRKSRPFYFMPKIGHNLPVYPTTRWCCCGSHYRIIILHCPTLCRCRVSDIWGQLFIIVVLFNLLLTGFDVRRECLVKMSWRRGEVWCRDESIEGHFTIWHYTSYWTHAKQTSMYIRGYFEENDVSYAWLEESSWEPRSIPSWEDLGINEDVSEGQV